MRIRPHSELEKDPTGCAARTRDGWGCQSRGVEEVGGFTFCRLHATMRSKELGIAEPSRTADRALTPTMSKCLLRVAARGENKEYDGMAGSRKALVSRGLLSHQGSLARRSWEAAYKFTDAGRAYMAEHHPDVEIQSPEDATVAKRDKALRRLGVDLAGLDARERAKVAEYEVEARGKAKIDGA